MNTVFILGAGFSRAIKAEMPLMRGLTKVIYNLKEYRRYADNFNDTEVLLSYLSQHFPWEPISLYHRKKADFFELAELVAEEVSSCQGQGALQVSDYLKKLVQKWHAEQTHILTLNYDTLTEQSFLEVVKDLSYQDLMPIHLTLAESRTGVGLWGGNKVSTASIYKLHGSINYFYSGTEKFWGETIYLGPNFRAEEKNQELLKGISDKVPLIVPPVFDKTTFFENESFRGLWKLAAANLNFAQRIVVIGYSLPKSDQMFRMFLTTNTTQLIELIVVDLNEKVVDEFNSLIIEGRAVTLKSFTGPECLQLFIKDYCKPELAN